MSNSSIVVLVASLGLVVTALPALASELCKISYEVRLKAPDGNTDTGSMSRTFTTCARSLAYCHTHAASLAKDHAQNLDMEARGVVVDPDSVNVSHIESGDRCDASDLP